MKLFRAAVPLLLAACGGEPGGALPPFPPPVQHQFPAAAAEARFALRADRAALGGEGAWLYLVGAGGWSWLGETRPEGGYATVYRTGAAPEPLGQASFLLPEGEWSFAGDLGAFLEARFPGSSGMVRSAPALWSAAAARLAPPEDEAQAHDAALSLAVLDAAAALAPRLLGRVAGAAAALRDTPAAELRLEVSPPLPQPRPGDYWRAPALPEGIAVLRLELPAAALEPYVERRLAGYGVPAGVLPEDDFVLELHVLRLDGAFGAVSIWRSAWALRSDLSASLLPELEAFAGDLDVRRWERGDAVLVGFGPPQFLAAVEREMAQDRPQPFAERRWSWPRGGLGLIVDLRAVQAALREAAPIPLPTLYSQDASERLVEVVAGVADGALRVHAGWPSSLRSGSELPLAGDDLEEMFNQTLLEQALRWLLVGAGD